MSKNSFLFLGDSFGRADGTRRADQTAEVATYAFGADDTGLAGLGVEVDSLMSTVHTRGITASTADALVAVNLWIDNSLAVEVCGCHEVRQFLAHDAIERCYASLRKVMLHAENQVVDDTVAILHHSSAYLHISAA